MKSPRCQLTREPTSHPGPPSPAVSWNPSLSEEQSSELQRLGPDRRRFFQRLGAGGAALGAFGWNDLLTARADDLRQQSKACIQVFLSGGFSQFETFNPKPGHANGGPTEAIATSTPGIHLAENLPHLAQQMDDLCILRSMQSGERNHARAKTYLHTGYQPAPSAECPTLGSLVSCELGDLTASLPNFVRVGRFRGSLGAGMLGMEHAPFDIVNPLRPPPFTSATTTDERFQRRLQLLGQLEGHYQANGGAEVVEDHRTLYRRAARLVLSDQLNAFDLSQEPANVRSRYGESPHTDAFMLARRLVEAGVPFVEVYLGGWDTHQDNFTATAEQCEKIDQPLAGLIGDLKSRGLLESTLVLVMSEFGRTPRINPRVGRDHYATGFSLAMAGCGVQGGQVIGATSEAGDEITDRPISVPDFMRTCCASLGIDPDKENTTSAGRPFAIVDGGEVVHEVFG